MWARRLLIGLALWVVAIADDFDMNIVVHQVWIRVNKGFGHLGVLRGKKFDNSTKS